MMKDASKTKKELTAELNDLHARLEAVKKTTKPLPKGYIDIKHCHALLDNISDLAYICDDKGTVLYLNNAFETITGHKPRDFIGKSFAPLFDDENLKKAIDGYQRTLKGESPCFEARFKDSGTLCSYSNTPHRDKDGIILGVLGTARDITSEKRVEEKIKSAFNDLEISIQERTNELSIEIEERKRTEKALKEAKETYEGMFLNSMVGMSRSRLSDGKFLEFNDRLVEMFGYNDREDFEMNTSALKCYANSRARERVLGIIKQFGEANNIETLARRKDGSTFWVQFSGNVDKEEGYLDSVSLDVTERKEAEEKLKGERERLFSILDSFPGFVYLQAPDHSIRFANKRFIDHYGDPADTTCHKLIWDRDQPCEECRTFEVFDTKQPVEWISNHQPRESFYQVYDYPFIDTDGTFLVLELSIDITEQKRAQEERNKSEERYRILIDNMNDGFVIVDKDAAITFINNKICDLVGYSEEEIIGSNATFFVDETNKKIMINQLAKREKGINEAYEIEYTRKDGSRVPTIVSPEPIFDDEGNFSGSFAVVTDITEIKKLSKRIDAMNRCFLAFGTDSTENITSLTRLLGSLMNGTCALYNRIDLGMLCTIAQWQIPPNYDPQDKPEGHICYDVIRKKSDDIFYINDLLETKYAETDKNVKKYNLKSYIGKAVTCNGNHVGSLCVVFTEEFIPSEEDKRYLEIIAVAIGIEEERKLAGEKLAKSRENSRSLSMHLQNMQEQERGRIARDIHDDLGQLLTALDFDLAYISKRLTTDQEDLRKKSAKMSDLIRVCTETVQRIASELRPAMLDNLGLMAAMEWQADEYSAHTGIDCKVNFDSSVKMINKNLSTALFRAFQEALTNAARHANPSVVSVNVKKSSRALTLEVSDDGKGISKEEITSKNSFGLSGIMERFYPFGGNVKINGIKGKGTTISIEVPIGKSYD